MARLFILAHYDDEIFALPLLSRHEKNYLIYLTNGVAKGVVKSKEFKRLEEALGCLQKSLRNFDFEMVAIGFRMGVNEGSLHENLQLLTEDKSLRSLFQKAHEDSLIITTSFEGGHQDHDSANVIGNWLAKQYGLSCVEFSAYRQAFKGIYSFAVMRPLQTLEKVEFTRFECLKIAMKLILGYKTQRKTWYGLGLATILKYACFGFFTAKSARVQVQEKCFYEFRGRADQNRVLCYLKQYATD